MRSIATWPRGGDGANLCTASESPCATVQHAVDVAAEGDEIRIAEGTYNDVHVRPRPPSISVHPS